MRDDAVGDASRPAFATTNEIKGSSSSLVAMTARRAPSTSRAIGFPPVVDVGAHTLLLGSMPGERSLKQQQYYAHPRNAFWPIMGELVGATPDLSYDARLEMLSARGFALWDVLASCVRKGSLDSAIEEDDARLNDFRSLLRDYSEIDRIFFNGSYAETLFRRRVLPTLPAGERLSLVRLPSTSPANASWSFIRKLDAWRAILAPET